MAFVENFIRFPAVQKFWKSVKIWQSYGEFKGENFICYAAFLNQTKYPAKSSARKKTKHKPQTTMRNQKQMVLWRLLQDSIKYLITMYTKSATLLFH